MCPSSPPPCFPVSPDRTWGRLRVSTFSTSVYAVIPSSPALDVGGEMGAVLYLFLLAEAVSFFLLPTAGGKGGGESALFFSPRSPRRFLSSSFFFLKEEN